MQFLEWICRVIGHNDNVVGMTRKHRWCSRCGSLVYVEYDDLDRFNEKGFTRAR